MTAQPNRFDLTIRTVVGGRVKDHTGARQRDLSGQWIDRAHQQGKLIKLMLDMPGSVSETYGQQESSAYRGDFGGTCYLPCPAVRMTRRSGVSRNSPGRGGIPMLRRVGVATLLGVMCGLATPAERAVGGEQGRARPLVLAHYMPWFESKPVSGQ